MTKHAKLRTRQRFSRKLTKKEHDRIVQTIRTNRAEFVRSTSGSRKVFRVQWHNEPCIVVYNNRTGKLVTLWPENRECR